MRVQFTISQTQAQDLLAKAQRYGYPDIPSYCKAIVLQDNTYGNLWKSVIKQISKMQSGETFALRDLIANPPANLGVKLYQNQKNLSIEKIGKDETSTNIFRKL